MLHAVLALVIAALDPSLQPAGATQPPSPQPDPPPPAPPLKLRILTDDNSPTPAVQIGGTAYTQTDDATGQPALTLFFYGQNRAPAITTKAATSPADAPVVTIPAPDLFFSPTETADKPVIAWTPDHSRVGLALVHRTDLGSQLDLTLRPACRVAVHVTSAGLDKLGRPLSWSNVYVYWNGTRPIGRDSRDGHHDFFLPPGDYRLNAYGASADSVGKPLHIDPTDHDLSIDIDLTPTRTAELTGHPAPEFTGIKLWKNSEPLTLAALRGKVVILDFWGYWCGPCVFGMPRLFELHDTYAGRGLVVIGVHDDSADSLDDLETKLTRARTTTWKGRDLPFPVALDGGGETKVPGRDWTAKGATTATYGIGLFPTTLIIDRKGILRGEFNPATDAAKLERLLDEAP